MMAYPILSHFQLRPLLDHQARPPSVVEISIDLELSRVRMSLTTQGLELPSGAILTWKTIRKICKAENNCFRIEGQNATKIKAFSEVTQRALSLYPTTEAPTMLVAGFPMHRIKDTTPNRDTRAKLEALGTIRGRVLDTATGLGYTAIAAAEQASEVITIELDPAALEIARQNPWSAELFARPDIQQVLGDSFEVIERFEDRSFQAVIHDPPTFSLGAELYSEIFYRQLLRVLSHGGRLFHYIGDPDSPSGRKTTHGVRQRLQQAGFTAIRPHPQAFGVLARRE